LSSRNAVSQARGDHPGASRPGRSIDESIALAKAYEEKLGFAPVPDANFAKDLPAAIEAHRWPLSRPLWDYQRAD
jgi:hypothetical protein